MPSLPLPLFLSSPSLPYFFVLSSTPASESTSQLGNCLHSENIHSPSFHNQAVGNLCCCFKPRPGMPRASPKLAHLSLHVGQAMTLRKKSCNT